VNRRACIGVFDSGVGGLSVLRHIREALPAAALLYVADSGHVPYGNKPTAYIQKRALHITSFLVEQGASAIVVACNTATAAAVASLRQTFELPIIGMEPGIKPALQLTRSGVIGVLATAGTLSSSRFASLVSTHVGDKQVLTQACPELVDLVERGEIRGPLAEDLVRRYTAPLLERGADTLILGCTHFVFLRAVIEACVGPGVAIVDTGPAVAKQVLRRLDAAIVADGPGGQRLWTSGNCDALRRVLPCLGGEVPEVEVLPG
jgi:glutamate racemase